MKNTKLVNASFNSGYIILTYRSGKTYALNSFDYLPDYTIRAEGVKEEVMMRSYWNDFDFFIFDLMTKKDKEVVTAVYTNGESNCLQLVLNPYKQELSCSLSGVKVILGIPSEEKANEYNSNEFFNF